MGLGVALLVGSRARKKRLRRAFDTQTPIRVHVKNSFIKERQGEGNPTFTYYLTVERLDETGEQVVEVSRAVYEDRSTTELFTYPGNNRLVHPEMLGGSTQFIGTAGLLFLIVGVLLLLMAQGRS